MKVRLWHIGVFVAALLMAAVAFAPISLFVQSREGGFSYRSASGSIWQARFDEARIGAVDAGAVDWRLSLFDLLQGRIQIDLAFVGGDVSGEVQLLGNWRGDRRIIARDIALEGVRIGNLLLAGVTRMQELDIYFSDGRCAAAAGRLTSDVLQRNARSLNWRGPVLGGDASCQDDGAAQLPLIGAAGEDIIQSRIELKQSGEGRWRVFADVRDAALRTLLTAHGFRAAGPRNLSQSREFRWLPF